MIKKLSHAALYVLDQDQALAFYTEKLGFEVRTDQTMDGFRWLTVGPKSQPDVEIVLMAIQKGPMWDDETVSTLKTLVEKGALGAGVFETDDCQQTYKELSDRGVEFLQPPSERPYGVEAMFRDPFGNWFSLTQRPKA